MGKKCGTYIAVRGREHAADGAGEAMHGTQAGISQRKTAKETGNGHILPSVAIAPISKYDGERSGSATNALQAKRVGHRVGSGANIRFDKLSQGVQAGAGGDGSGQIIGKLRIHQCHSRQHQGAAQADLDPMFRRGEDGIACHFGAGTGCSGNGDKRHGRLVQVLAVPDNFKKVQQVPMICEHCGDGLTCIDGATTAKTDYHVAIGILGLSDSILHSANLGFPDY